MKTLYSAMQLDFSEFDEEKGFVGQHGYIA
jgi:hypothetical protein